MLHSENKAVNNGFFYLKKLMCTHCAHNLLIIARINFIA
jgi:hypothetical protein